MKSLFGAFVLLCLAACHSQPIWRPVRTEPTLTIVGKSYADPSVPAFKTFHVIATADHQPTHDLEAQQYATMLTDLLVSRGYSAAPIVSADMCIFIECDDRSDQSLVSQRVVPTTTIIPGSTDIVRSGPLGSISTITHPGTFAVGTEHVTERRTLHSGKLFIDAYDLRAVRNHEVKPEDQSQAWVTYVTYGHTLPAALPGDVVYGRLMQVAADKLGKQIGSWSRVMTAVEFAAVPIRPASK